MLLVYVHYTAGHLHTRIIRHRDRLQAAQMAKRAYLIEIGDAVLGQLQRFERPGQKLVALAQVRDAVALHVQLLQKTIRGISKMVQDAIIVYKIDVQITTQNTLL